MGLGLVIPLKWIVFLGLIFAGGVIAIFEYFIPGTGQWLLNGVKGLFGL